MAVIEQVLFPNTFGMELIYSFVIIVCSLLVYFSTKKMYDLSKYQGIKYFRMSFLFFAIAYFFKSFISFLFLILEVHEILEFSTLFLGVLTLFFFMYASTMAIFYLLYSVVWKDLKEKRFTIPLIHILVLVISALSIAIREVKILLGLQIFIFLFIAIYNHFHIKKLKGSKKPGHLHMIYLILFVFWMLNLADLLISGFNPILEILISMVSIGLFLVILYKVVKNVGSS
ncbi:hypothetical protein COT60_03285 [Candidatus Pacearchaeota archaeon CG09_land_8_20_14_0_10_30_9]|nr:hypothetical protein [Candidatus Pacearchaeota archaeon]OIO40435.1 MAG: hypothetical protein AUJ61_01935 [Candidatus Pacearchaeota archaeon CG1_02_30_18]PIN71479.1 MAG: hypothetical protein COV77_01790 [Candidatus Pacearchaeota archaeon CG11_big_fil_rev_8_21_14_0_20_30_13]PIO00902.1 MAG: hypothetical protein COT60_03285 [Candidatus Pacearchaeota archaeon CG09_land_8_20_14_0_10_30_9]PIZ81878.1 MAG: hypothetical protein COX98_01980 [Candidatus Pacearchaeota archaeon CG_4_10_14_0_2_um_filter_30